MMSQRKSLDRFGALYTLSIIACLVGCSEGSEQLTTGNPPNAQAPMLSGAGVDQSDAAPSHRARSEQTSSEQALFEAPPSGAAQLGTKRLEAALPNAKVQVQGNRIRRVFGMAASGITPSVAAKNFLHKTAPALGIAPHDLTLSKPKFARLRGAPAADAEGVGLMYDAATDRHKFRLFTYHQHRDGVPVFRGSLRTLVREGGRNPVVWANADLRSIGGFRRSANVVLHRPDVNKSLAALLAGTKLADTRVPPPVALTNVSAPTPTIFAGVGAQEVPPRMAMTYTARDANGPGKWTFVADASSGDILHVESDLHFDVDGSVQAEVVAGQQSMGCGVLEVTPLPHAVVTSAVGDAITDSAGAFTLVDSGSGPLTVVSGVTGQYFNVNNSAGNNTSLSLEVTPPGPANFLHQDTNIPPELVLAQLNAYKQVNQIRDMLLTYLPEYPIIAEQTGFPINVNLTGLTCEVTGGAWYDDDSAIRSLNFCQSTAERANTAFGSIVHHEYGHHIIDAGGSAQNAYGEGMADTIAMLFSKDPQIGIGYHLNQCDEPLRRADRVCQYSATQCSSCGSGLYECGALLSGTIWDIWQELNSTESSNADDIIRSLVLSSIPMHTGDGIDESIAIDLLTLDDDDGLVENGTPHYDEICAGFTAHGMSCPPILDGLVVDGAELLDAEGPSDGPFAPASVSYTLHNLGPEANLAYSVTLPPDALWLTVDSLGGTIALDEQATVTVSIDQAQAALLPDGNYSAMIDFVNETSGVGTVSREAKLRVGAPVPIYTATFTDGSDGFTADNEPGNIWHQSTACADPLPGHSSGGSLYYGKDECNYAASTPILHTVTSPVIDIANPAMAQLGFKYFLATENDPNYDSASVLVSVDGGPFSVVASNNDGAEKLDETTAWEDVRVDIWQLLPATGPTSIRLQFAFNAGDPNSNTKTGFVVDDVTVYAKPEGCTTDAECDDNVSCNGGETCVNQVCIAGTSVPCDSAGAFLEHNGTVVIEAENSTENTPRVAHSWELASSSQASAQALMSATPDYNQVINSNYAATSPQLTYPVRFSTTGTYYVWIRGIGPNANGDSCHVGIGGVETSTADRITGFNTSLSWSRSTMDGPLASIQVIQAGLLDVNVWMREDGFSIDKLVLTTNPYLSISGSGPVESERESPPSPTCTADSQCSDGNECTSDICYEGVCSHTDSGSCISHGPCAAYCNNPVAFGSNHQSGNLGPEATCHETTAPLNGGVCGNFVSPRQLFVNGVPMTCNWSPWASVPSAENGGHCVHTTNGGYDWASFATW